MSREIRTELTLARASLVEGVMKLGRPNRDPIENQVFVGIEVLIRRIFLSDDKDRLSFDRPYTAIEDQFIERISRKTGHHVGDRALRAHGYTKKLNSGEKLSLEESAELKSFLSLLLDAVREQVQYFK